MVLKQRDIGADNLKGLLAILVVFGHFLCFRPYDGVSREWWLVQWIYTFHMPCFAYVSGMFTRYKKHGWHRYLYLYILWYTLECLFTKAEFNIFFPGFGLWYLVAMQVWPYMSHCCRSSIKMAGCWFVIAVLIGFVPFIGRMMSVSRIICFFGFYLLGTGKLLDNVPDGIRAAAMAVSFLVSVLFVSMFIGKVHPQFFSYAFYCDRPYVQSHSGWGLRCFILFAALCFIITLRVVMPDKPVRFLTHIGQNTLPLYLMHLCVVGALRPYLYSDSLLRDMLVAVGMTVVCCAVFTLPVLAGTKRNGLVQLLFDEKPLLESFSRRK